MILFAAMLLCATAFQDAPKLREVALPYDWKIGTRVAVTSDRGREDRQGEKLLNSTSSRTSMTVEVIDRREDGYTMRWTFGKTELIASLVPTPPHEEVLATLLDGLVLDLVTDPGGTPQRLADPAAVEARITEVAKAKHAALIAGGAKAEEARYVLVYAETAKGPLFHANLMRGPSLFMMAGGAKLLVGERKVWNDQLPNPFGGDALPSLSQLWVSSVDDAARSVVVEWRNSVDVVRGKAAIEASIRDTSKRTGRELPPNAVFDLNAIEDASTSTFDLVTGWPRTVVYTRTSQMFEVRRIDSVRFEAKPLEPR